MRLLKLLVACILNGRELVIRIFERHDQLGQLDLQRQRVAVLRVLDQFPMG
jgi:hypothetical protein